MRKWAYEIHSCFLLPDSPLKMASLDAQTIQSIDSILLEEHEREETLQVCDPVCFTFRSGSLFGSEATL